MKLVSEIKRNWTFYRTFLKCRQHQYVGSVPRYCLTAIFSETVHFKPITKYTINSYFINVHSSKYRVAVLHKHVFLAVLTGDSINFYRAFVVYTIN